MFPRNTAALTSCTPCMYCLQGRRMIENTEEIVDVLRARYPAAHINLPLFDKSAHMTHQQQVGGWVAVILMETEIQGK